MKVNQGSQNLGGVPFLRTDKTGYFSVRLEKAADGVLSKEQPADLPEVVATLPGAGGEMKDMENVTEKFLTISKTLSTAMLQSTLCLHKGSMNSVLALGNSQQSFCGVFLAKEAWNAKWHVTQIVLSTSSVEETLEHERVKARCKNLGLVPAGALVVSSHKDWHALCSLPFQGHPKDLANKTTYNH